MNSSDYNIKEPFPGILFLSIEILGCTLQPPVKKNNASYIWVSCLIEGCLR